VTIEDLGSKNGTFVGENRIDSPVELRHGDEVRLGHFSMTVKIMLRNEETETA
jgi:pSer/pThr/pTyr-binding forkhead associated (FHA) protein